MSRLHCLADGAFEYQKFRILEDASFSEFYLELEDASVEISAGSGGNTLTVQIPKEMATAVINAHRQKER